MDKTRHYYTLCRAASPLDTPPLMPGTPAKMVEDEGIPEMEYEDEFSNVGNGNEENLEVIIEEPEVVHLSEEMTETASEAVIQVPEKTKVQVSIFCFHFLHIKYIFCSNVQDFNNNFTSKLPDEPGF